MTTAFEKDFKPPRSLRQCTGYVNMNGKNSPAGTVLHVMLLNDIHCNKRDHDMNIKPPRSFLVLGIVKKGWMFSNYKKPSKGAKFIKSSDSKDLFEVTEADANGIIKRIKVMAFDKLEKSTNLGDKGNINMEYTGEIAVGMTLQFHFNDFIYQKRDEEAGTLPLGIDILPAYSLAQIVVTPVATPPDDKPKGYGLKLSEIRPLEFSLHSYMHPAGLYYLPPTFDKSNELLYSLLSKPTSIERLINGTCHAFFGKINPGAYMTDNGEEWMRLGCKEDPVMESIQEIDVHKKDLLHLTNAGNELGYAIFLMDLAAAAGALNALVIRDPNFARDPSRCEFRGFLLVDTEKLLAFIDTEVSPGEDKNVQYDLPFKVETLNEPFALVKTEPEAREGEAMTCSDFILCSTAVEAKQAFEITIGDSAEENIMTFYYAISKAKGTKRSAPAERMDYRQIKSIKA